MTTHITKTWFDGKTVVTVTKEIPVEEALAQPEEEQERNFCPRCGKRTADLTTIHTCTPPRGNT